MAIITVTAAAKRSLRPQEGTSGASACILFSVGYRYKECQFMIKALASRYIRRDQIHHFTVSLYLQHFIKKGCKKPQNASLLILK